MLGGETVGRVHKACRLQGEVWAKGSREEQRGLWGRGVGEEQHTGRVSGEGHGGSGEGVERYGREEEAEARKAFIF